MLKPTELELIIQALLLSSLSPLSENKISSLLAEFGHQPDAVRAALASMSARDLSPLELTLVASGYRLQLQSQYTRFVAVLQKERPAKYPRSVLESLAIIAYRQPITRAEIETIRGVNSGSRVYQALFERGWIRVGGHKDSPGRPELLVTTKEFLDHFALSSLKQLPQLAEADKTEELGFVETDD